MRKNIKRKMIYSDFIKELKNIILAGATAGWVIAGYWLIWFFITK